MRIKIYTHTEIKYRNQLEEKADITLKLLKFGSEN